MEVHSIIQNSISTSGKDDIDPVPNTFPDIIESSFAEIDAGPSIAIPTQSSGEITAASIGESTAFCTMAQLVA